MWPELYHGKVSFFYNLKNNIQALVVCFKAKTNSWTEVIDSNESNTMI